MIIEVMQLLRSNFFAQLALTDACDLRLLGLRTTDEVLKQLPVILEAKSVDEGD